MGDLLLMFWIIVNHTKIKNVYMSGLKKHGVKNIYTPTPVIVKENYQQPLVPFMPPSSVPSSTYSEIITNQNLIFIIFLLCFIV